MSSIRKRRCAFGVRRTGFSTPRATRRSTVDKLTPSISHATVTDTSLGVVRVVVLIHLVSRGRAQTRATRSSAVERYARTEMTKKQTPLTQAQADARKARLEAAGVRVTTGPTTVTLLKRPPAASS